jgi:hypothetical protein
MSTSGTSAGKRYQGRVLVTMLLFVAVMYVAVWIVKHTHPHGWLLYTIAPVPALPMLATLGVLARYLQEEKDEYLRLIAMRSLLVGAATLLTVLVVNDFLRSISGAAAIPPFASWVIFFVTFSVTQAVQTIRDRVRDDA